MITRKDVLMAAQSSGFVVDMTRRSGKWHCKAIKVNQHGHSIVYLFYAATLQGLIDWLDSFNPESFAAAEAERAYLAWRLTASDRWHKGSKYLQWIAAWDDRNVSIVRANYAAAHKRLVAIRPVV